MKLIVSADVVAHLATRLATEYPEIELVQIDREGQSDQPLDDAVAFMRWWTPRATYEQVIRDARALRWIHTPSAGVEGLIAPELRRRGIVLTNSAGAHAVPIAEFVLMFVLSHAKQVPTLLAARHERRWAKELHLDELSEKTMLIIGLGNIGAAIAHRAAAFGMRVIASRRHPRPTPGVERVLGPGEWRAALPEADYVVVATPLTQETSGMIDAAAFALMRPTAYLINIARGAIVHEPALLAALREGRIAGAGLDALAVEPLPPDHALWQLPNVFITPHISWSSPMTASRTFDLFFENLRRFRAGLPLLNVVDLELGY